MNIKNTIIYKTQFPDKYYGTLEHDCDRKFLKRNYPHASAYRSEEKKQSYSHDWRSVPVYHKFEDYPAKFTFFSASISLDFCFYEDVINDVVFINFLKRYGEILPLECADSPKKVYGYHCMEQIGYIKDCLTENSSECYSHRQFKRELLPQQGIFTFSNDVGIYSAENANLPIEDNFMELIKRGGYTGLEFKMINCI